MKKDELYRNLLIQVEAIVDPKADDIANMANVAQLLTQTLGHHWSGFYRVIGSELVLGPYAGPLACTRIAYGKGVCGKAWETQETQVVADVHLFDGHIACSASSNSEIVVPCIRDDKVFAVLDIDSVDFNTFDGKDALYLKKLVELL